MNTLILHNKAIVINPISVDNQASYQDGGKFLSIVEDHATDATACVTLTKACLTLPHGRWHESSHDPSTDPKMLQGIT